MKSLEIRMKILHLLKEKEFWIVILLVLIYFYRPLFGGETFFFRDISWHLYAEKQFLISSLKSGEIPFWNPYLLGGEPYFNNIVNSSLYPFNLIFFVLPFIHAFNVFIVIHYVISAAGSYFCGRVLGLRPHSSLIVSIIYTFCGGMLSLANLPGLISDMPYLPIILAFWHLFMMERRRRWFLSSVLCGVFQALAWTHEGNEITMLIVLGWTLCFQYTERSVARKFFLWTIFTILIVGISAILIIPVVEIIGYSGRQYGFSSAEFGKMSFHPKRMLELVFPWFFGQMNAAYPLTRYWGGNVLGSPPFLLNLYMGWNVCLLAVIGGLTGKRDADVCSRRVRRYCLALIALFIIGSFGRYLPGFQSLYAYIPFIDFLLHSPEKFVVGIMFPVAFLAGYASDRYFSIEQKSLPAWGYLCLWGMTGALILFAGGFSVIGSFAEWLVTMFFARPHDEIARDGLRYSFMFSSAMVFLLTALAHHRRKHTARWHQTALVGILLMDLWISCSPINFYAPEDLFTTIPDVVPLVKKELGDGGRLFRPEGGAQIAPDTFPSDELMWVTRQNFETLDGFSGFMYDIPQIFHRHHNDFGQKDIVILRSRLQDIPWEQRWPLLSAAAITTIITPEKLSWHGIELIGEIPNFSNQHFFLYRNPTAANRVEFVTKTRLLSTRQLGYKEQALSLLTSADFDPRKEVILFSEEVLQADAFISQYRNTNAEYASEVHIKKEEQKLNSVKYLIETPTSGYLVLSEPFYPGWEMTVDGEPAPQLRANLAFTAIPLPAGEHIVTRKYVPKLFYYGAWVSLGFCCLTVILTHKRFGIVKN